jgi:hypothetical protein
MWHMGGELQEGYYRQDGWSGREDRVRKLDWNGWLFPNIRPTAYDIPIDLPD